MLELRPEDLPHDWRAGPTCRCMAARRPRACTGTVANVSGLMLIYLVALHAWFGLSYAMSGEPWWLFLANTFAPYLFLLVPVAVVVGVAARRPDVVTLSATGVAIALYSFGPTFTATPSVVPRAPDLTVMTYNLHADPRDPTPTIEALRSSGADLIALQELNAGTAAAIGERLAEAYPHQVLAPAARGFGVGVIGRIPFEPLDVPIDGTWVGPPQVVRFEIGGTRAVLVNVHAPSVPLRREGFVAALEDSIEARNRSARGLAAFARERREPLVVVGDFNTTARSEAHRIVGEVLRDAWRLGGSGFGHTFPGGPRRVSVRGVSAPPWLLRIDYVFHSTHWQVVEARIGPWDEESDHRPVVADLVLVGEGR